MVSMSTSSGTVAGEESFASLFEESLKREELKEGDIVKGKVIALGKDHVIVDIGYKSEGAIPLHEFTTADGTDGIKEGDEIAVFLESRENEDGLCILSKEKADRLKVWDEISGACERDELIEGTISARVKGGLSVTIRGGVKAFLPGSQVDLRPIRNLDKLIGQTYKFKVIKFNKKRGNIVLSRRVLLERERDEMKAKTLETLTEGMTVKGTIKNITEYGAFVDLGGIDGLLHITDMSWGRVNHPSEVFQVGDEVMVKVLKYNAETERVSLGLKQTQEDPWNHAEEAYPPGKKVRGKVMSITDYGVFVRIEEGVDGMVHKSDLSWTVKVNNPADLYHKNDDVEAIILSINHDEKKVSLGIKQLVDDPWPTILNDLPTGTAVEAAAISIVDYGVFVRIRDGIEALVPTSDLIEDETNKIKLGDKLKVEITNLDTVDRRVTATMKNIGAEKTPSVMASREA